MNLDRIDEVEAAGMLAEAQVDSQLSQVRAGFRQDPLSDVQLDEVISSLSEDAHYCDDCGDEIGIGRLRAELKYKFVCTTCVPCKSRAEALDAQRAKIGWVSQ